LEGAANLHGHLVITHGTMDDNVHLQNAIRLVNELQRHDKTNFELMLYPKARHGIGGPQGWHLRQLIWSAIERQLLASARSQGGSSTK
jgi:dipeptidyl-peptidase-4